MADISLTEQRDRFLAFAFAASDVLIEVDGTGHIVFVAGSTKSLLGRSINELMGTALIDLVVGKNRVVLREYLEKVRQKGRGSNRMFLIDLKDGTQHQIDLAGMSSPQRKGIIHIVMREVPLAARQRRSSIPESPMSVIDFANSAALLSDEAKKAGAGMNFAMYDVDWSKVEAAVGQDDAEKLNETLVQTMHAWSAEGSGVGQIGKGKYSLLLAEGIKVDSLADRLTAVAKESNPILDLDVSRTTISLSDVIDTDDFGAFFEDAMTHFDEVGGEAFDLSSFKANQQKASKPTKPPAPSSTMTARQVARRKGVTEGWG